MTVPDGGGSVGSWPVVVSRTDVVNVVLARSVPALPDGRTTRRSAAGKGCRPHACLPAAEPGWVSVGDADVGAVMGGGVDLVDHCQGEVGTGNGGLTGALPGGPGAIGSGRADEQPVEIA
jgi:hypothetical protein